MDAMYQATNGRSDLPPALAAGRDGWRALTEARRASLNLKASQVEDKLGR